MIFARLLLSLVPALLPVSASARASLGLFEGWGVFRDARPPQCYAISEPRGGRGGAYATVTIRSDGNPSLHFRLRQPRKPGSPLLLAIGGRKFALRGVRIDAWPSDPRADDAIIAAMRGDGWMWITAQAPGGRFFTDGYALAGAASAIDAATLGCARLR